MNSTREVTHAQLDEAISRLHLGISASDLHGSLTGYLCAGTQATAQDWLAALQLETDASGRANTTLRQLRQECAAWLDDPELRFEPLLPVADVALSVRAEALVEWCRGFLGGLGLAGILPRDEISEDAREILQDFASIASSRLEYAETEEDEKALAEVIEFIRVGVMLLHAELSTTGDAKRTLH